MSSAPPIYVPPTYGAKVLVIAGTGMGKTHALRTLKEAKVKTFVIFSENGMRSLADTDPEWVDWHYVAAVKPEVNQLIATAKAINTMDRKQLANFTDAYKSKHVQYIEILQTLANLKGDRTGKTYGKAEALGPDFCIALDSLSGLSLMSMELVGGDKPMFDQGEWGIAMGRVEKLVQTLCMSIPCHVVVNAHEEREDDPISGGSKIMVSVPGKKLAPKVPRFFDDVFYGMRQGTNWFWSTDYPQVMDLKSRHLGIFKSLPQDFSQVIRSWQKVNQTPAG